MVGEMSDEESPGGCSAVWIVVAVLGVLLALGVLALFAAFFLVKAAPVAAPTVKPPPIPPQTLVVPVDATPVTTVPVKLELTGTGEGGTWYTLDGAIYEGDAQCREALAALAAEAAKSGRKLATTVEAVSNAGITDRALAAARKLCLDAGALVVESTPPPGAGKEKAP